MLINKDEKTNSDYSIILGNHAVAEGAIAAECRFFAGYPITPASEIARAILQAFDATLVEINPLVLTTNDQIIAADAKMTLDDNASFSHRELYSRLKSVETKT